MRRALSTPAFTGTPDQVPRVEDELSPLLSHDFSVQTSAYGMSPATPRRPEVTSRHPRNHHRIKSLRRALSAAFGHNQTLSYRTIPATPADNLFRVSEHESAYDQFTSIDWIRDSIASARRSQQLHTRRGMAGLILSWWEDAQGWILAGVVGFLVAVLAYLVDVTEATLFDVKLGYCKTRLLASFTTCCDGEDDCDGWMAWSSVSPSAVISDGWKGCLVYTGFMLLMCLVACAIVLSYKRVTSSGLALSKSLGLLDAQAEDASEEKAAPRKGVIMYPTAGSGVAEVKVIASGFVIHGFLGFKTLILKAVGVALSVASGLSVGKEGPFVHCAACIGNVMTRFFPKYRTNAAKTREIVSAASAAGVAVAFGAPISGVLFSLEEVSYYFPAKTLFRTFFCSIVAAVTLRFLDPYGTSKIVLFQVEYHTDWKAFEMPLFIFMGSVGGALGALFVKSTRVWTRTFRRLPVIRSWPMIEVAIVAIITGAVSYWNRYTKLPVTALILELASDCRRWEETGTGLCPHAEEVPDLLVTLATAFVVKAVLTVIAFGIKVPAGIYVPSMVVGGLLGRFLGHAIQYILVVHTSANCSAHGKLESCVVPGVYALLTAGAVMVGVTRLSITIAVMLFELSGSLNYVLPFSIAVMFAKWTADAVEPLSIYVGPANIGSGHCKD